MNNLKLITAFLLIGLFILSSVFTGCKKDDDNPDNPPAPETGTFTDSRDSHVYKWIKIGKLTWMAENLAYKPSRTNGCIAYDNDENNVKVYGYLYNQETAKAAVPSGWRLPTEEDFRELVNGLGGDVPAYNKLLESGTEHWQSPNKGNNESGFTALPAGHYNTTYNEFWGLGQQAVFVSSSLYTGETSVMVLNLNRNMLDASVEGNPTNFYYSVRCVKN